jgi:hypothetical protein
MKVVITTTPELKAELYKSYLRVRNEKNIIRKKGMLIKAEEVIEEKVGFLGASKKIAKILRRAVRDKIEWDEEKFNKAIIKERRLGSPLKNYYGIRYSELEALDHAIYMANGNP